MIRWSAVALVLVALLAGCGSSIRTYMRSDVGSVARATRESLEARGFVLAERPGVGSTRFRGQCEPASDSLFLRFVTLGFFMPFGPHVDAVVAQEPDGASLEVRIERWILVCFFVPIVERWDVDEAAVLDEVERRLPR